MYSYEDRLKAVRLLIQYGGSPTLVIRELGYPVTAEIKMTPKGGAVNCSMTVINSFHFYESIAFNINNEVYENLKNKILNF